MNPHAVLGVVPGASSGEVRAAWRRAARATHPDNGGDQQAFELACAAYRQLRSGGPHAHGDVVVVHRLGNRRLAHRWLRRKLGRSPSRVI